MKEKIVIGIKIKKALVQSMKKIILKAQKVNLKMFVKIYYQRFI